MLKKSHRILYVFAKNPTITYLFGDIKDYTGSKSESYTYNSLKAFVKDGILTKEKKGGLCFYKIADTPKAVSFLSIAAEYKAWNKKGFPTSSVYDLIEKTNVNFFTLLVVGSYAKNKKTEKSDLDIILIVQKDAKKISSRLRHFCEMNIPQIHLYVFTDEEFKQMLLDKKHNYGKEAVKHNLIFYGAEAYYKMLFEAMKNGFTY
jgi:predicted nucleotidyltransferase